MSNSEEKTPTVSPDQGATGETTTSSGNTEVGTQTGLSEEEEEARYKEEYNNAVFQLLGKRSTPKRGEIAKKIKGADGNVIQKYPILRIGFKVTRPTVPIDNYDAWYKAVESRTYDVPKLKLSSEQYRKIMEECVAGLDSDEEEEVGQSEGVIDLEDYLEDLKEQDEEWAKRHSIQCL